MFKHRIGQELPELLKLVQPGEMSKVDKEFEDISRMDCDKATQKLSKEEFERVATEAVNRVRKKRKATVTDQRKEEIAVA